MRLGYEQYQRPANKHGLVSIYNDRYRSRINCRGKSMSIYQAEFKYKKSEPWYDFRLEAENDAAAELLAINYEAKRLGAKPFARLFKSMTVKAAA
jgi:hypothetical protein